MRILIFLLLLMTFLFVSCNKAHYPPYAIQEFDDVDFEVINR